MSTKKIITLIVATLIGLVLLVAIFVGGVVGFAIYTVGHSEAAGTSRKFLRENKKLKDEIGEVKDFGSIVTGNVNVANGNGAARISLKVIGEKKTVNADVDLMYRNNGSWRVVEAFYFNDSNVRIDLLEKFEPEPPEK
jgi:hypothetical protein